jgi:hypothetical protein
LTDENSGWEVIMKVGRLFLALVACCGIGSAAYGRPAPPPPDEEGFGDLQVVAAKCVVEVTNTDSKGVQAFGGGQYSVGKPDCRRKCIQYIKDVCSAPANKGNRVVGTFRFKGRTEIACGARVCK